MAEQTTEATATSESKPVSVSGSDVKAEAPTSLHPEAWAVRKGLLVLEQDPSQPKGVMRINFRTYTPWQFCAARVAQKWPGTDLDPTCPQRVVDSTFTITEAEFDAAIASVQ